MKVPKSPLEWKTVILKDWPSRMMITVLTAFAAYAWTQGKAIISSEGQKMVLETVRPAMDSLRGQVDTLKEKVESLQDEQEKSGRVQQEFFGAMMEAIPALKKAVEDRGKQNNEVAIKKKETEKLLTNLTEMKP
jgi:hypothetical protein